MEASGHEEEVTPKNQTHHDQIRSAPARTGARQSRGFEQSHQPRRPTRLSSCHRRIRRLVLFRTALSVEQDSSLTLSRSFGIPTTRSCTINLRFGAVRRLAYEAADCGLLSADLAAGIRRVKGVKKLGVRLGNWLTAEQAQSLWLAPDCQRLKGKRDRALLALLLACGLRRHEAVTLTLDNLQQREEHWAIVDLVGKAGHVRTVPVPGLGQTRVGRVAGRSCYRARDVVPQS